MLTFVAFWWHDPTYHTRYDASHIRRWAEMVRQHYRRQCRLVLVTDQVCEFPGVEVVPLWQEHAGLGNPHGPGFPSCYRRLYVWSREAAGVFGGERLVVMDLDVALFGDATPVFDRPEDVVLWRDPGYPVQPYNGGLILLRAGAHPEVWDRFRGRCSIDQARRAGRKGSDQGWIAHVLGPDMPVWTAADGVVSWKRDLRRGLPGPDTRIVLFHGRDKPWHARVPSIYR